MEEPDIKDDELLRQIHILSIEHKSSVTMNSHLLSECKEKKEMLDCYYNYLYLYIASIQTSVIVLSTLSAFLQALQANVAMPVQVQSSITLVISRYISLVLSLSKFYKLDERKESAHNLREKFAEIINKISFRLDTLRPWSEIGFIHRENIDEKMKNWVEEKNHIRGDYYHTIESKEKLFVEFEKLVDYNLRDILMKKIYSNEVKYCFGFWQKQGTNFREHNRDCNTLPINTTMFDEEEEL